VFVRGRREARVVFVLLGVTAEIASVRRDGVDVADPLVIGEEEDALAEPHRPDKVAVELGADSPVVARTVRIDPQMPGRPAAIALPARRVDRVAAEYGRAVLRDVERHRVADAEGDRLTAFGIDTERERLSDERRACIRGEVDGAPVARPAAAVEDFAAEIGEPPRPVAFGVHHVQLGMPFVPADEGEPRAVGREPRQGTFACGCRQSPCDPAYRADDPEIVLAHEDDAVVGDRGRAHISSSGHTPRYADRVPGTPDFAAGVTRQEVPANRLVALAPRVRTRRMQDERSIKELLDDVHQRVERRTFIQDLTEPLTGEIDRRKIAAKVNNLEHAVDELATVVERVADEEGRKTA
jgi:hypothetical protein